MKIVRNDLVPESGMDRTEMLAVQDRVRAAATFTDDPPDVSSITPETVIGGADLAFDDDDAIAAAVAIQDGKEIARSHVRTPVSIPYIPGLLAFREAGPMLDAIAGLDVAFDILFCDGNGRLHPREAGLATHIGVVLDQPTVGVAKRLLCGELINPPPSPFPVGTRVPIGPDESMKAPPETILGYAVQTRQWEQPGRSINPIFVSPGTRISPESAADVSLSCTDGFKLPEPIRAADRHATFCKREG